MINRLITVLQQAGLILSDDELASFSDTESLLKSEDLADAIWLALQMGVEPEPAAGDEESDIQPDRPSSTVTVETIEAADLPPFPVPPTVPAYIPEPKSVETTSPPTVDPPEQGLPIQVRAAPSLQEARSIARALRPLRRKAPSRTQSVLDVAATINRIAEQDVWLPVLKPAPERWLDLELVIESSQFSFIWQSTLDEFQQILEQQGTFRDVRTWQVQGVDQGQLRLVPKQQTVTQQTQFRSPKELIDASGRRLVLYVSDCRSSVWQQGKIHDWLRLWSQQQPTAIVQLLPERLWEQSELDVGSGIQVSSLIPGAPNHKLIARERIAQRDEFLDSTLVLPVVTLTARSLRQLALVVAAIGNQRAPARWFDLSWVIDPDRDPAPAVIQPETAEERVDLFLATASPTAQRLARMMAAVPVSLPVIHLIQERLLKDSTPVHVAEVYSSSLLRPVEASTAEAGQYDFYPGVRQLLNESTSEDETIDVLQELSQEIAATLRFPPIRSFTALLSPQPEWTSEQRAAILPFAQVTTQVLYNLGGDYADLAQRVEQDAARYSNWIQPLEAEESAVPFPELEIIEFTTAQLVEPAVILQFPPLQTQEVEVVTIVFEAKPNEDKPEGLQQFEFEVATIERKTEVQQPGFLRGLRNLFSGSEQQISWVIRKQRRQAYQWVEHLGETLELEMVSIPAGTFLMGSPEDEVDRTSYESPHHEVSVPTFFMGKYPITQAQWRFVVGLLQINRELNLDPSSFKGDKRPVEQVSWYDAVEFCDRLSAYTKREYRLPTEAEWEYACRAGTTTPFHFGETITTDLANYAGTSTYNGGPKGEYRKETTPVDHFGIANAFGLCDMHGNVWEWCLDHWHQNYEGLPIDGSAWLSENEDAKRVVRGGSWDVIPEHCRSAFRLNLSPVNRHDGIGFRVVCVAPRTL